MAKKEKTKALNTQFVSVFTEEDKEDNSALGEGQIPKIPDLFIHEDGVLKHLQGLLPTIKTAGAGKLPPWFFKMFAEKLIQS